MRPRSFLLRGGLNVEDPFVSLPEGAAIDGQNYLPVEAGYLRMYGYERVDGRQKASKARFQILKTSPTVVALPVGTVITGSSTNAKGTVIEPVSALASEVVVLLHLGPEFESEEFTASGFGLLSIATVIEALRADSAETAQRVQGLKSLARERQREMIQPVPGIGPVRGVYYHQGQILAFRDHESGLRCVMWTSSPNGWQEVSTPTILRFYDGQTEPEAGQLIIGASSGAQAFVRRILHRRGAWDGQAEGALVIDMLPGPPFSANEQVNINSSTAFKAVAPQAQFVIPPGGTYSFDTYSFRADAVGRRVYIANGVGPAMEWDGEMLVPIYTGMDDDRPVFVAGHADHLFLAFRNGSLQHSVPGEPFFWDAVSGAAEIGMGDEITGLVPEFSGALVVLMKNRIATIQGQNVESWQVNRFSARSGARAYTIQVLDTVVMLDDGGVRELQTTERFGDFTTASLTEKVRRILAAKRQSGVLPVASAKSRNFNHYYLFWNDRSGLCIFQRRVEDYRVPEVMVFRLPDLVACSASTETDEGEELILLGLSDGRVVQMNSGHSFDGLPINAFVRLAHTWVGGITVNKRFHRVDLFVEWPEGAPFELSTTTMFGRVDTSPLTLQDVHVEPTAGFWDVSRWDEFLWSAEVETRASAFVDSFGESIGITIATFHGEVAPHILKSATVLYSLRGVAR